MKTAMTALCSLVALCLLSLPWVRVNVSASLPIGLYRLHPVPAHLAYGQLVLLRVPESVRPWHSAWRPLLKPVAGLPRDVACTLNGRYWIQNVDYGPVLTASAGKPLPQWTGCAMVPVGEVVVASRAPKSLDSRYFGAVAQADIRAVATPLWTFGDAHGAK